MHSQTVCRTRGDYGIGAISIYFWHFTTWVFPAMECIKEFLHRLGKWNCLRKSITRLRRDGGTLNQIELNTFIGDVRLQVSDNWIKEADSVAHPLYP